MKLDYIPVPLWSPPHPGPWAMRSTRPTGEQHVSTVPQMKFHDRAELQWYVDWANSNCREGCTYDIVPWPGDA